MYANMFATLYFKSLDQNSAGSILRYSPTKIWQWCYWNTRKPLTKIRHRKNFTELAKRCRCYSNAKIYFVLYITASIKEHSRFLAFVLVLFRFTKPGYSSTSKDDCIVAMIIKCIVFIFECYCFDLSLNHPSNQPSLN